MWKEKEGTALADTLACSEHHVSVFFKRKRLNDIFGLDVIHKHNLCELGILITFNWCLYIHTEFIIRNFTIHRLRRYYITTSEILVSCLIGSCSCWHHLNFWSFIVTFIWAYRLLIHILPGLVVGIISRFKSWEYALKTIRWFGSLPLLCLLIAWFQRLLLVYQCRMNLVLGSLIMLFLPCQECTLRIVSLVANGHCVIVIVLFHDHDCGVVRLCFNCWSDDVHRVAILVSWFHERGSLYHTAEEASLIVVLWIVKLTTNSKLFSDDLLPGCVFLVKVIFRVFSIHL